MRFGLARGLGLRAIILAEGCRRGRQGGSPVVVAYWLVTLLERPSEQIRRGESVRKA